MHRYSNQDHSTPAANSAASSMISGGVGKREIWNINSEDSYHGEIGGPTKIATQVTPSRLCFTHRGLESTVVMTCLPRDLMASIPKSRAPARSEFISLTRKQWIP
jgi:hypothetical protein